MAHTLDNTTDNYSTDKKGWELIKDYIPKNKLLWAPFYSNGKQKDMFFDMDLYILHMDKDFFSWTPEYEIIIDNPPYSKMKEISIRLKALDKPFILILPTRYFGIKFFMDKFKDHIQVIIPSKRPTFTHLTDPKEGYTPPGGTYYFCYKMNLPKDLIFL
tara:strand:- start:251 stop:727 length:477 start_codon:yes stop_codon:yes gene_type:complete